MRELLLSAVLTSVVAATVGAQEPQTPPAEVGRPESSAVTEEQIAKAITDLGSRRFKDREAAEDLLRKAGESARPALQGAVDSTADSELRWRAQRLLDELSQQAEEPEGPDSEGGLRRLRDGESSEAPRVGRDLDPVDELRRRIDEMRREFDQMFRDRGGRTIRGFDRPLFDRQGLGSGTSVQIGPDGVRVEVTETDENGEISTEVFEAPDMESFRAEHPEIAERHFGGGSGLRVVPGLPEGLRGFPDELEDALRPLRRSPFRLQPNGPGSDEGRRVRPQVLQSPGPKLGVFIEPVSDQLSEFLGLTPGDGLFVREVQEGSMAAELGLKSLDVVVRVAGQAVGSADDVARILGSMTGGEEVTVDFLRGGEARAAKTAFDGGGSEPADRPELVDPEPEPGNEGGGLQPIRRRR